MDNQIEIFKNVKQRSKKRISFVSSLDFADSKETVLSSLKSPKGFKRYLKSPIRYGGGKSLAVAYLLKELPPVKRVISPFFGGGSFEIACALELGLDVLGFDIFDILVNYWQVQIKHPRKLFNRLSKLKSNKKTYNAVKEKLKLHWKKQKKLNPVDLAVCYFFNHNLSYGPGFLGWMSSIYEDKRRYDNLLKKVLQFKTDKIQLECRSFESVIPSFNKDFLYLDPPYYLDGNSKMFRGIYPQRNFPIHHKSFDHELLRDLLYTHKGKFILSYNDCDFVRKSYKKFKIKQIGWQYTMGQGETRIGFNRINEKRNHIKKSHELLIIKD